jgi:hypothetical protein
MMINKLIFISFLLLFSVTLFGCTQTQCSYQCDFHACFNESHWFGGDKQVSCSKPHDYRYNYCFDLDHNNCPSNKTEKIYNDTLTRW